ncbi:hypothetical protein COCNU_01G011890 [Cocos nucifera]|uniref:Clu domain-containing protein n=1 Tax=Cocos nucifera TaxID=13894 RepID=A0A8K0HVD9_COCNU|nr:hypothetical protein COCNU_01G011890 [Cocos nucifera]
MAGKSNKARNKGRALNSNPADSLESESKPLTSSSSNAGAGALSNGDASGIQDTSNKSPAENVADADKEETANPSATTSKQAGGDVFILHLGHFTLVLFLQLMLKTMSFLFALSPGDSVMDVRQFLLDAPETCFFTSYDLILHTKDGSVQHLEDYNEISEVADITTGGCTLEMVAALYDERSIRSHVRRARELLSLSTLHVSLSTLLALQHETAQQKPSGALHIMFYSFMFEHPSMDPWLVGDLIYIDVVTLEGNKFCITGTSKAFYVNSSTGNILDPRPSKPAYEASTLISLLQKISSKFKKGFREILDRKASAHPFETVQSLLPPNSWLGHYPVPVVLFADFLPFQTHNAILFHQEADVPGLYNLAMAIIDYRGYRVVAQSIIPGILQGDKSDSLLYGSVDNGKKICWDESFHSKVVEAAKRLHLKEHTVMDGSGNVVKLAAPVESKGIIGSDDRHYLLDLMRVTPRDANYSGPGHRFCVLRPELVASFCEAEAAERSLCRPKIAREDSETPDSRSSSSDVMGTPVEVQAGEECASAPAEAQTPGEDILLNPNVFTEFKLAGSQEDISTDEAIVRKAASYLTDVVLQKIVQDLCSLEVSPMDGQSLTDALHAHGINVRYLGKVADMVKHLPHLWDICSTEIVVRSAKHILKDMLRESQDHDLGPAIAHFFNCFAGNISTVGTKGCTNNSQSKNQKKGQENHKSPDKSGKGQMRWRHGASSKKGHSAHLFLTSEGLWSYVREFARFKYQVGITIAARKFDLDSSAPFQTSDVLDLQPVVKHSVPMCSEARNLMESGKARLAEITGPMHRDVANCCRYGNMALFYHGLNQTELALRHMSRTLLLLSLSSGPDHPDVAATFINVAMMYQDIGNMNAALRYLQEALKKNERLLGPEHIQTAHEKKTYDILVNQLGEEDSRTQDSENWIKTFKLREQQAIAQKQKGQAVNTASALKAIDILKAFQAAAGGSGNASASSVNKSLNAAIIGESLPRGRGVDERAARAAAEMRKKAAARGLLVRQNGVPVQALPPLTQLLNIINSGATASEAQPNAQANEPEGEANNGSTLNGTSVEKKDANGSVENRDDQGPVGLGTSLASLDSKKQKSKPKATP